MTSSTLIKCLWVWGVVLSIGMSYHVMVNQQKFDVLTNEDGLPSLEDE